MNFISSVVRTYSIHDWGTVCHVPIVAGRCKVTVGLSKANEHSDCGTKSSRKLHHEVWWIVMDEKYVERFNLCCVLSQWRFEKKQVQTAMGGARYSKITSESKWFKMVQQKRHSIQHVLIKTKKMRGSSEIHQIIWSIETSDNFLNYCIWNLSCRMGTLLAIPRSTAADCGPSWDHPTLNITSHLKSQEGFDQSDEDLSKQCALFCLIRGKSRP
jgi:hypothetical protein